MSEAEQIEKTESAEASNVETLPAVKRQPLMAGGQVKAIIPQSMEEAFRIATAVVVADMAPRDMRSPEKCLIAIMQGAEVGMTPMQSLQRIAVINGRSTIWGDAAIGLVRASGLCGYVKEWIEGEGDQMVAYCEAKRKGETEPVRSEFSVADATAAGLWNKAGPWKQYPKRMLQMRARGFALRDGFADVLGGMYLREEMEGEAEMKNITPTPPPAPPAPANMAITPSEPKKAPGRRKSSSVPYADRARIQAEAEAKARAQDHDPETGEVVEDEVQPFDLDKWLDGLESALVVCTDQETLDEVWDAEAGSVIEGGGVFPPDQAKAMLEKHTARIEAA